MLLFKLRIVSRLSSAKAMMNGPGMSPITT